MSTQNIMWTVLPNGLNAAGDRLKLSVVVSPRLVTSPGPVGTLAQFPDFLDWPATVGKLKFRVEVLGGPTVDATANHAPLDSAAWAALFNPQGNPATVRSYSFDDRSSAPVRSFPTKKVVGFLKNLYQQAAIKFPRTKPTIQELGFPPTRDLMLDRLTLDQVAVTNQQEEQALNRQINEVLKKLKAVPASCGTPKTDFQQVRLMHDFLSARDASRSPLPLPEQKLPDTDFHKVFGAMGQYPELMRALGIAIDLEIPAAGIPANGQMRIHPDLAGPDPMIPWTAYRIDAAAKLFVAAALPGNSDVVDGMLLFPGPTSYEVVEMDVDGAAEKVMDFAHNMARLAFGIAKKSIDTPNNYGLPSLRSGGFSAARVDRAVRLTDMFQMAKANNTAITVNPNANVVLHAEDVTRGYRIDVWDSVSGKWHSLHQREGVYNFLNGPLKKEIADEGFVTMATSQSADGTSTDLRLPESLFRWAGWSLSAPRAGRTIGDDSKPAEATNPALTDFKLETKFRVAKGTLPRLRFGMQYQFRARAVDLAGNSFAVDTPISSTYTIPITPMRYLRYEPVVAPAVVLRYGLDLETPGESGDRIVIRSNFDAHIDAASERHIAPPKTTVTMAEEHGMLDTLIGQPDKKLYEMLISRDGTFATSADDPAKPVPHPEAQLSIPYLPDPLAAGASFLNLPGTAADSVTQVAFSGMWPDAQPFRLVLDEGIGPPVFSETERMLRVHLDKAEMVQVPLSCYITEDPVSKPANMLSLMKIWSWITEAGFASLQKDATDGKLWLLTPARTLTLVHAVQKPLIEPRFEDLRVGKKLGDTFATLTDEFPISGKSTAKLDIEADWSEPVDDGTDNPQPVIRTGVLRAFEMPFEPGDTVAVIDDSRPTLFVNKHEFHDTKHRNVTYRAVATTRFKEYFQDTLTAKPENITRTSQSVTISVPNSARPDAPKVLYVLPTFQWERGLEGAWTVSRRKGGGLRVYLDRPWFSSGEGELLGAVLLSCAPPPTSIFNGWSVPDFLKGYITQWGKDPIWTAPAPPTQAMPVAKNFLNPVAVGTALTLDEAKGVPVDVVGHEVRFDTVRKLWYCDIEMDPGNAYFPFVRLALVRYQPESIADAHLSRVVLADFAQLMPDRAASITLDPVDLTRLDLAITGPTYQGPGQAVMSVTLQTQAPGSGDQAWVPLAILTLTPKTFGGPDTLWMTSLVLPAPQGSRLFRLLIEEFEFFSKDGTTINLQKRLVYADILDV